MKKIIALLLSFVLMMSIGMVASADDDISRVTYYMEYNEDGTATLIFQTGSLGAFDFGVVYNPEEVTVSAYDYSEEFYKISTDDEYTAIYVKNDKAVDNEGKSTYVVFTGAVMKTEDGEAVNFGEKNIAAVTFSNISEGDEVAVVTGTAQMEDVRNATCLGAVDLYEQMEIGTSSLMEGAASEPGKEGSNGNNTWIYGVVFGVIIVAAVVLALVSKKGKLDVSVNEVAEDEEEFEEDEEE